MAKVGRGGDQFVLRLPEGLRDRIKLHAERSGRSMNTEIVDVLEEAFPEPWTLDQKITQLGGALFILRRGLETGASTPTEGVDDLLKDVRETLEGIATGRVMDVDEAVRQEITTGLQTWLENIGEAKPYRPSKRLDSQQIEALRRSDAEKF